MNIQYMGVHGGRTVLISRLVAEVVPLKSYEKPIAVSWVADAVLLIDLFVLSAHECVQRTHMVSS